MKSAIQPEIRKKLARKRSSSAVYRMVKAEAPATSANLGPGFDVFGLALDLFYDRVEIELVAERGRSVSVEGVGREQIPTEVQKNTAGLVADTVMDAMEKKRV